jgi:hypothetical protein
MRTLTRAGRVAQAGFAAVLLLVILVLGSLYALLSGVNSATAELQLKRDDATTAALNQAKDALIAWSAMRANGPGHLLCPDDDNDGLADTITCGTAATRVGRLPWRTLGLPDLRDAHGERLWYAVSRCFLERAPDGFCGNYAVNSDRRGQLAVTGLLQANGVVAIIFSPGQAIARTAGGQQVRSAANVNDVTHYLEGENADAPVAAFEDMATSTDLFEVRRRCEQTDCPGGAFNDQLVLITHADLFDIVENVVDKRLATEIAPLLRFYRDTWAGVLGPQGFYPFAVPFTNPGLPGGPPSRDTFCSTAGTGAGLLPVSQAAACITAAAPTVIDTFAGSGTVDPKSGCGLAPAGEPDGTRMLAVVCSIFYTGGPLGTPNVRIPFAGAWTLALPIQPADVRHGAFPGYGGPPWGAITTQGLDGMLNFSFEYSGTLPFVANGVFSSATITLPVYSAQSRFLLPPTSVDTSWFFANEWYRNTYYAVVPQQLPRVGGGAACTAPNCLTVLNTAAPNNDKQVVLVLAGRSNNGVPRPTAVSADYFELENDEVAGPTPGTFSRQLRSSTFNDKVVVVAPCTAPGPTPCP